MPSALHTHILIAAGVLFLVMAYVAGGSSVLPK